MLSRKEMGNLYGVWDMGLPLRKHVCKTPHDNYYIPVHSRVGFLFSQIHFCMKQTPQKSVHFTITFDCLFSESSIFACEILC